MIHAWACGRVNSLRDGKLDGCGAGRPAMHEGNEGVDRIGHDWVIGHSEHAGLLIYSTGQGGVCSTVTKFRVHRVRGTRYVAVADLGF